MNGLAFLLLVVAILLFPAGLEAKSKKPEVVIRNPECTDGTVVLNKRNSDGSWPSNHPLEIYWGRVFTKEEMRSLTGREPVVKVSDVTDRNHFDSDSYGTWVNTGQDQYRYKTYVSLRGQKETSVCTLTVEIEWGLGTCTVDYIKRDQSLPGPETPRVGRRGKGGYSKREHQDTMQTPLTSPLFVFILACCLVLSCLVAWFFKPKYFTMK